MIDLEDCCRPELGVVGLDFGFLSLFDATVVLAGRLTCCLFCAQLGNDRVDGDIFRVVLEQGEFDELGVDG